MAASPLHIKSKAFSLEIIRACNKIRHILISSINTAKENLQKWNSLRISDCSNWMYPMSITIQHHYDLHLDRRSYFMKAKSNRIRRFLAFLTDEILYMIPCILFSSIIRFSFFAKFFILIPTIAVITFFVTFTLRDYLFSKRWLNGAILGEFKKKC